VVVVADVVALVVAGKNVMVVAAVKTVLNRFASVAGTYIAVVVDACVVGHVGVAAVAVDNVPLTVVCHRVVNPLAEHIFAADPKAAVVVVVVVVVMIIVVVVVAVLVVVTVVVAVVVVIAVVVQAPVVADSIVAPTLLRLAP
jgi:hypothetical protein